MKMKTQNPEIFLTASEAAKHLNVSSRTIQRWVEKGTLKAWRTAGGKSRIYLTSVQQFLHERGVNIKQEQAPRLKTVLVVEDQPELLEIYEFNLNSWQLPIRILTATNGFEALVSIGQNRPTLIITDLKMPGMDGLEMINSLRKNPDLESIKIIAVTMLTDDEIKKRGGLPSDITLFKKPVQLEDLEVTIRQLTNS
jgi:excisionase family DNA binding protein